MNFNCRPYSPVLSSSLDRSVVVLFSPCLFMFLFGLSLICFFDRLGENVNYDKRLESGQPNWLDNFTIGTSGPFFFLQK